MVKVFQGCKALDELIETCLIVVNVCISGDHIRSTQLTLSRVMARQLPNTMIINTR